MRFFGRELSQYRGQFRELYKYPWFFLKCCFLFKRPWKVIRCYLKQESPDDRTIECRGGLKILLSDHPHDVITVFVVFVRQDYGKVESGSVVLDVGANIGVFSLYAAQCGASRVYAVEPSSACYRQLLENISTNHLTGVVTPLQRAIFSTDEDRVNFPRSASPYNAIVEDEDVQDLEAVETVSLGTLVKRATADHRAVHCLKLDCEGGEYEALLSASNETMSKIRNIKMEYHQGRVTELIDFFERNGFRSIRHTAENAGLGSLWVRRD